MPLRYVGLRVTDLKRSLRFYSGLLRLREIRRGDLRSEGLGIWVLLEDPKSHQRLELNWYPKKSSEATAYVPGDGLDHVGFLLGKVTRAALEKEYRRLIRGGARPTSWTPERMDGWVAHVRDPDGNWVEIFRWPTVAEERAARRAARPRARLRRSRARRRKNPSSA